MSDPGFQLLLPFLHQTTVRTLLIADENLLHSAASIAERENLTILTNRFDVYSTCLRSAIQTQFSDYDFSTIGDNSLDQIIYRISKEKPVVHHIINQSLRTLKPGGQLILVGEKNEGIKTYITKASKLLGKKVPAVKHGTHYLAEITKIKSVTNNQLLDDQHYEQFRVIAELDERPIISKPGLFGWDKIDAGSKLLMDCADGYLDKMTEKPATVLDLGCGYGYLSLRTAGWSFIQNRAATDNNAAAIAAIKKNAENFGLNLAISADDCARNLNQSFQLILCNPPFHQGFSTDSSLTDKFLQSAHRCLSQTGTALFVVNQFIPLEKLGSAVFSNVKQLCSDGKFKVLALQK